VVFTFFVLFSIWFLLEKSDRIKHSLSALFKKILLVAIPITAITSFALTIIVGHSGAEATWKDRIAQSQAGDLQDLTPSTSPKPNTNDSITLSISETKIHNSKSALAFMPDLFKGANLVAGKNFFRLPLT